MNDRTLETCIGDRDARRRAVEETDRSFVVEASAGTGKTRTLLDRILYLVLERGPDGAPVRLSRICAITFTEKAAGEMKVRLRQELEKKLLDAGASPDYLERIREALDDLETASISTFHSFAVSLLKERPIEAELDPRFAALDDLRSELFFREVWEPWISRALMERHPVLEKALRNGFRLLNLVNLAKALRQNWLNIRELACDPPPSEEQAREEIESRLRQAGEYLQNVTNPKDKLAVCLGKALIWLEHPAEEGHELSKPGGSGIAANWTGGKEMVKEVQGFLREVVDFRALYAKMPGQRLFHEVVCWIKEDFMKGEWEKRKRSSGLLDFDDQLRLARDLLLQNKTVRREFQRQYRTLLVDEFQDTDAIQWDIVLLLASTDIEETDLAKLKPEPGRLFIVGDPKQSIYRFRNADIETYLQIVDTHRLKFLGLEHLKLTTNFRSVPSILRFVDAAFKSAMNPDEETRAYQPEYLAFGNQGYRNPPNSPNSNSNSWTPTNSNSSSTSSSSWTPTVHLLGDIGSESETKLKTLEVVENESRRIANLILEVNGSESWKVEDPGERDGDGWRSARFGDIAVLLPVLTHAHVLEEKLRDLGIPYVLEGGKFYYARSEVSTAILVLRAIANPNDSVALYGSLRSIFFGLSDEDLLRARIGGLPLDYRKEIPRESPLWRPYEIFRDLHRRRYERRASETFEVLLRETRAREVLAARGSQSLANLSKLGRTLRAFQGIATFSQVVDLLGMINEEELAESESRLMEERGNAVRIMSIHKAKGLDFPIVIAAALGLGTVSRAKDVLVGKTGERIFSIKIGSKDFGMQSSRWQELADKEKKRENEELVRLLYVALTRARDHMVLSAHTASRRKIEDSMRFVPNTEKTRLNPLNLFLEDCYSGKSNMAQLLDAERLDVRAQKTQRAQSTQIVDWESIVLRECRELSDLVVNVPASENLKAAAQADEELAAGESLPEDRMPESAANRSVRLGVAFHRAMERADFSASDAPAELVREMATQLRLDAESARLLQSMMQATLSSEVLDQVRAAAGARRKVMREVPFMRHLDSAAIEEGKIDLLFEREDGWVLVDYKTDWVSEKGGDPASFFRNKYAAQICEYVAALRARSIPVAAAYLLLARTGSAIRIDQLGPRNAESI